jgi:hypothetical protein
MKWKTDLSSTWSRYSCIIIILLLLASHLPFLTADPDIHISFSRGPFTDEGLNTIQVRNWVNLGYLDLDECDNLLKTPLLGFSLALPYKIFGTSLMVSRLHVILLLLTALGIICSDRKHRPYLFIFIPLTLLQYQVFQFSHFSLAEILSSASILLAIHFFARSLDIQFNKRSRQNFAILSAIFITFSYYFKIQFIYIIPLILITQLFLAARKGVQHRKMLLRQGVYANGTLLIFLLFYLFAWYLPNREAYDFIMSMQSGEFSLNNKLWDNFWFNLTSYFFQGWFTSFSVIFLLMLPLGFFMLLRRPSARYPSLFLASLAWFLLETHKLAMVYLPTRYRISLYIAMGLLMSIVIGEILLRRKTAVPLPGSRGLKLFAMAAALILLGINVKQYVISLERRTYVVRDVNRYLAGHLKPDDTVIGAWAPSLTWDSRARALPVWNNFLNYRDPVQTFNPRVVISEKDEQDSERAYLEQGISLQSLSDSSKTARIGNWDVVIYWMK